MSRLLFREIERLKRLILGLGAAVEESLHRAVTAVQTRDAALAEGVIEGDAEIDQMEIDVEEESLKILALHQPVAIDLRFIVAVLKINSDLERIGDLAANMAERAVALSQMAPAAVPVDLTGMTTHVKAMVKNVLDALVNLDAGLAREVCAADDVVDNAHREMYERAREQIQAEPETADRVLSLLSVSRGLERIADHTTNVAQDVIYMLEGEIVRHRGATP